PTVTLVPPAEPTVSTPPVAAFAGLATKTAIAAVPSTAASLTILRMVEPSWGVGAPRSRRHGSTGLGEGAAHSHPAVRGRGERRAAGPAVGVHSGQLRLDPLRSAAGRDRADGLRLRNGLL